MRHPDPDDLAAYALGALDDREQRRVAEHVGGCERCSTQLRERLFPATAVLAESVEQVEPPPELRSNLMEIVDREAGLPAPAASRPAPPPRRSGWAGFLLRPAAGLAVLALVAAGIAGYLVAEGDGDGSGSGTETVTLSQSASGVGGSLVRDGGSATLQMHGMEQLDRGAVYQVWVAGPSGVLPSAAFVPHQDGTAIAAVPEAAGEVDELMITREPMAGRTQPTLSQTVFDARL